MLFLHCKLMGKSFLGGHRHLVFLESEVLYLNETLELSAPLSLLDLTERTCCSRD